MISRTLRRGRAFAALVTGAMIASISIAGFALPASAADQPAPAAVEVTGGSFTWGVSKDYREALPVSENTRAGEAGATFTDADLANFPLKAENSWDGEAGTFASAGAVRIGYTAGPDGNYLRLESPVIQINGNSGTISAIVTNRSHTVMPSVSSKRLTIAALDLSDVEPGTTDTTVSWDAIPATLTEAGQEAIFALEGESFTLMDVGTALDPVSLAVEHTAVVEQDPDPTEEPSPEPTATSEPTIDPPVAPDPTDEPTESPSTDPTEGPAETPKVTVSKTSDIDRDGEQITVKGSGFLPEAPNTDGKRPPLKDKFGGAYVILGQFDADWKPSTGAEGGTRDVNLQQYLGAHSPDVDAFGSEGAEIKLDGTFEVTFDVSDDMKGFKSGREADLGIYTYAASGAVYEPFETFTPVMFADAEDDEDGEDSDATPPGSSEVADPVVTVSPSKAVDPGVENKFVVKGKGFVGDGAAAGTYVLLGDASIWKGKGALEADGWLETVHVSADKITNGSFKTTVTIPANQFKKGIDYTVATSAAHWLSPTDRSLDTFTPIAVSSGSDKAPTCDAGVIKGATLNWGVKESFRNYITGSVAKGSISVKGKNVAKNGGAFAWSAGKGNFDAAKNSGKVSYSGTVQFRGHGKLLNVKLTDPTVTIKDEKNAVLSAKVRSTDPLGKVVVNNETLTIAKLDLSKAKDSSKKGLVEYSDVPAVLTKAGEKAFVGNYDKGEALDPVSFALLDNCSDEKLPTKPKGPQSPSPKDPAPVGVTVGSDNAGEANSAGETGTQAEQCVAKSVSGATFSWGVKQAFTDYISGNIANGTTSTSGPSKSGNAFTWSGGSGSMNTDKKMGSTRFGGSVNFTGHGGILKLTLSNPRVVMSGSNTATLILDANGTNMDGDSLSYPGVRFATLNLAAGSNGSSGSSISYSGVPATLTAGGAQAFAGFYDAGTALDPVSFTLPLGATVECDTASGTLPSTGSDFEPIGLSLSLLVVGIAAAVIARKRRHGIYAA